MKLAGGAGGEIAASRTIEGGGTSMAGLGWQELLLLLLALGFLPAEVGALLIALLFAWG